MVFVRKVSQVNHAVGSINHQFFFLFVDTVRSLPPQKIAILQSHVYYSRISELIILLAQGHYPYILNISKQIKSAMELLLLLVGLTMTCVQSQHCWTFCSSAGQLSRSLVLVGRWCFTSQA